MRELESNSQQDPEPAAPRVLPLIPAALLALVAVHQIHLARSQDLDPWQGGGFGMFSTGVERHTHVFVTEGDRRLEVDLPDELEDLEDRVLVLPTAARLAEMARKLGDAQRDEHPDRTGVRVEVWQTTFDVEDLSPETVLIRELDADGALRDED